MEDSISVQTAWLRELSERLKGGVHRLDNIADIVSAIRVEPEIAAKDKIGGRMQKLLKEMKHTSARIGQMSDYLEGLAVSYEETERLLAKEAEDLLEEQFRREQQRINSLEAQYFKGPDPKPPESDTK